METIALPARSWRVRCYYRPLILAGAAILLLSLFWFATRYPQLLEKAQAVGEGLPSMAWSSEVVHASETDPLWRRILFGAVNWLDNMKVGMSFGVLLGALLHTALRHYPLKIGNNLTLNSLKGALVGAPMGVCANCAVPTACGVTRGHGRVEVALGFLFSSPSFNPVVATMTFTALPLGMAVTKYVVLLAVILLLVPRLVDWLERRRSLQTLTNFETFEDDAFCAVPGPPQDCEEPFGKALAELAKEFGGNVWMLAKPTLAIMVIAAVASSAVLVLLPWQAILAQPTPSSMALVSLGSVFMPVPIALDVMFAAQLHQQGIASGYVMLFLMTLGTYSVIPTIYLWREVSKPLAAILFVFFAGLGWVSGLVF